MEYPPSKPEPPDQIPVLNYARLRESDPRQTPTYVRALDQVICAGAILLAIPIGCGGIIFIWRWVSGTVSADLGYGLRFSSASALLLTTGVLGLHAASR